MATISRKIEAVLALKGISKSELARRLNTSPQNISQRIKRGTLTIADLEKIAEVVGADFSYHFNADGVII